MPFKVCILTVVHQPFNTRVFHKEAKTLTKAGYDVILIAQHNKDEIVDGVKIIALPKPKNRSMRTLVLLGGFSIWLYVSMLMFIIFMIQN